LPDLTSIAPDSNPSCDKSSARPITDPQAQGGGPTQAAGTPGMTSGLRTVSILTFLSRVLGLVRDVGMAAVFGTGPLMDAFSVAFRVPNLARGMFGEGALAAAFLPAFLQERTHQGDEAGWRLASGVIVVMTVGLTALVLVAEVVLGAIWMQCEPGSDLRLLIGLTAVLLPYLILVCVVAQLSAVMYGLNHFLWPSLEPVLANVVWIACLWWIVPWLSSPTARIYAVALAIVGSGLLQLVAPLPTMRRLGFHYAADWRKAQARLLDIGKAVFAVTVGLSVTQLNSLLDGLTAWGFTRPESGSGVIPWLPGTLAYPLEPGTASALYFGQRVYQFPLGVFGVALGTVLFPVLSRHAAENRMDKLRADLLRGLKLVLFISVPASAGLVLLARPITILLFEHGSFDAAAVQQTTGMVRMFGCAVWAYCGILIVHRGFYAVGDRRSPLAMSFVGMVINLSLDLILMWFQGGPGLALATAVSSAVQFGLVVWLFEQRVGRLDWRDLRRSTLQTCTAAVAMSIVCALVAECLPPGPTWHQRLASVLAPMAAALAVYFGLARVFKMGELPLLFRADALAEFPRDETGSESL
jgi:putative peptidoglycan lipid II flippase